MSELTKSKVMTILDDERRSEVECAMAVRELRRKTLNPVKRFRYKQAYDMFMSHAFGIQLAMYRIEKAEES